MTTAVSLVFVVIFLLMNAFFVIAEFSCVRVRKSQIELLVEEGKPGARAAATIADDVNSYLSACQLGITLASLALGWLGEPAISALFHPLFAALGLPAAAVTAISVAIGYIIMTTLHVVIGELVPKSMAMVNTERYALFTAGPLYGFYKLTWPIMWLFNATTNGIMRLMGHKTTTSEESYSEDELKLLLEESAESGSIERDQYEYVDNIFELDDKDAKSIMTPRTEVLAIDIDATLEENLAFMEESMFSRYPVYRGDKDTIIGFVHIKDAWLLGEGATMRDLRIRPIQAVPESLEVGKLLSVMQQNQTKIAVVVDEHGGTSGIVTMADIMEQIVGRTEDEYAHDEADRIIRVGEGRFLVDGTLDVDDFVEFLGFDPTGAEDYETAGGLVCDLMDRIPEVGDTHEICHEGIKYTVTVTVMDGRRIDKMRVVTSVDESWVPDDEAD